MAVYTRKKIPVPGAIASNLSAAPVHSHEAAWDNRDHSTAAEAGLQLQHPDPAIGHEAQYHPHPKQGSNKLRIILNQALFGPSLGLGGVRLGVALGSSARRGSEGLRQARGSAQGAHLHFRSSMQRALRPVSQGFVKVWGASFLVSLVE